jgi:hypothetical protein
LFYFKLLMTALSRCGRYDRGGERRREGAVSFEGGTMARPARPETCSDGNGRVIDKSGTPASRR